MSDLDKLSHTTNIVECEKTPIHSEGVTDVRIDHPSPNLFLHSPKTDENISTNVVVDPTPLQLTLLMIGISLSCFLVALDRTIVATAIPRITDTFQSPGDIGWYGSAYLLTSCAFQPSYGYVFANFDVRWSFLGALGMFEVGSLVCGVAPNSSVFIVGRAIAGTGCAGVFAGALVIISMSVEPRRRPMFTAIVGSIFGIGTVCGPLLGGAFTTHVSWRWCFYFNLPAGAVTSLCLLFFFHPAKQIKDKSFRERLFALDLLGNVFIISTVLMLLLALQWGGTVYDWDSSQIIGLLIGTGAESVLFFIWEWYFGDSALLPLKIITQRTVASSFVMSFFMAGATLLHSYFLPFWFQAIRGESAIESGVHVVPYVASTFVFSIIAGVLVTKTGYFTPPALLGPIIATIGSGLLTTLRVDTPTSKWVGYEILTASGIGIAAQQGLVATQAVLPKESVAIGSALILFAQSLSGAVFVSVGNSLLRNELFEGLSHAQLAGVDISTVLAAGSTQVTNLVPETQLENFLVLYNIALDRVLILAVPLAALGFFGALPMEWRNINALKAHVPGEA